MNMNFLKTFRDSADILVIPAFQTDSEIKLASTNGKILDFVQDIISQSTQFKAKCYEFLNIPTPSSLGLKQIVIMGLGQAQEMDIHKAENCGGKLFTALKALNPEHIAIVLDQSFTSNIETSGFAAHLATGFKLRSYNFDAYKSKKDDDDSKSLSLNDFDFILDDNDKAETHFDNLNTAIEGVFFTRNLVNAPPNDLYPESYAQIIKDELKPLGVEIEILDEKRMQKLGMGAILAVGMGSSRKPRMVIMRWNGSDNPSEQPIALVGKGVTFDTGGISLKPGAGMEDMKMDMGGSASVVGAMKTIALRKSKANVVAVVGLAENMPSSTAYRPADILKTYSGKTIEVLNTDAEGRLVLADCLEYVQDIYKPHTILDLATLTGAMMVALGFEYCGAFVNNKELWDKIEKAGESTAEKIWRMPLDKAWNKEVESSIADVKNLGSVGRWAGACTAAAFLEYFVNEDTSWAHLDIAGVAWSKKDKELGPKHGTGYGVRLLDRLIAQNYESV